VGQQMQFLLCKNLKELKLSKNKQAYGLDLFFAIIFEFDFCKD
jgi:hypothetical protein